MIIKACSACKLPPPPKAINSNMNIKKSYLQSHEVRKRILIVRNGKWSEKRGMPILQSWKRI